MRSKAYIFAASVVLVVGILVLFPVFAPVPPSRDTRHLPPKAIARNKWVNEKYARAMKLWYVDHQPKQANLLLEQIEKSQADGSVARDLVQLYDQVGDRSKELAWYRYVLTTKHDWKMTNEPDYFFVSSYVDLAVELGSKEDQELGEHLILGHYLANGPHPLFREIPKSGTDRRAYACAARAVFRNTSHNGVRLIQEAIRLRPMDPRIHWIAGEVYYDAKMRKESLAEYALSMKYPGIDDYQLSVAKLKAKMSD